MGDLGCVLCVCVCVCWSWSWCWCWCWCLLWFFLLPDAPLSRARSFLLAFRNLLTALIKHERIVTTTPRAKAVKPMADKLVTLAKKGTFRHRLLAMRMVYEKAMVFKLFGILAPRYLNRNGGYTRVLKLSKRRYGDAADMSVIEFVDRVGEIRTAKEPSTTAGKGIGLAYEQFKKKQGKGRHPGLSWLW